MLRLILWQIIGLILTGLWSLSELDSTLPLMLLLASPLIISLLVMGQRARFQRTHPGVPPGPQRGFIAAGLVCTLFFVLLSTYVALVARPAMRDARDLHHAVSPSGQERGPTPSSLGGEGRGEG